MPHCSSLNVFQVKHHLVLEYNINLAFLVLLKTEGRAIQSHPVIGSFVLLIPASLILHSKTYISPYRAGEAPAYRG